MNEETLEEVVVEESAFRRLKRIGVGVNTLVLRNEREVDADGEQMAEWFSSLPRIDKIENLILESTSRLRDVRVVKGLPGLANLQVNGLRIRSLDGLEQFCNGRYINIDTDRNKRRSIAGISQAPIKKLTLQYAKEEDFDAISASATIRHLELGGSPNPPFQKWRDVPIEILGLSKGAFKELACTSDIASLESMTLIGCRRLERITGENDTVRWLVVSSCAKLDLGCVTTFRGLRDLFIVANRRSCTLSSFAHLSHLKILSLEACDIKIDTDELNSAMPSLEQLHILGLNDRKALQLSRLNPNIAISTGREVYRKGAAHPPIDSSRPILGGANSPKHSNRRE
jgi:hypothetical protein